MTHFSFTRDPQNKGQARIHSGLKTLHDSWAFVLFWPLWLCLPFRLPWLTHVQLPGALCCPSFTSGPYIMTFAETTLSVCTSPPNIYMANSYLLPVLAQMSASLSTPCINAANPNLRTSIPHPFLIYFFSIAYCLIMMLPFFYLQYLFLLSFSPCEIVNHENKNFGLFCSLMKPECLTHSRSSTNICFKYSPEYYFVNHFFWT